MLDTNLTVADALISFLIGIVGSLLAAYLYSKFPKIVAKISDWWSTRSKYAAHRRAAKLSKRLLYLERFTREKNLLVTQASKHLIDAIVMLGTSIIMFIFGFFSPVYSALDKNMPKLKGTNLLWIIELDESSIAAVTLFQFATFVTLGLISFVATIKNRDRYLNLMNIEDEVTSLKKRITDLNSISHSNS